MNGSVATSLPISVAAVLVGILILVIGLRSRAGRIRRNPFTGIRTRASMASPEAFAAANRAGAPMMMVGGVLAIVGGLIGLPVGLTGHGLAGLACAFVGIVLMGVCAGIGGVVGNNAAKRVDGPGL